MTGITIQQPRGLAPRIDPLQLSDTMAQVATNTRLDRFTLEPWRDIADVQAAILDVKTIFQYNGVWETADEIQHVVPSIVENDILNRLYLSDSEYPKIRSGAAVYRLGVPPPDSVITAVVDTVGDTSNPLSVLNVSYLCSFVDAWGAEGTVFTPSITAEVGTGFQVTLTLPGAPTPPNGAGNWNLGPGALVRIYRSNTGASGGIFQFLANVPFGTGSFIDTATADQLGTLTPQLDWDEPPNDDTSFNPNGPLQGLIEIPNGVLAGYTGNTVCFSEPFVPTAWPVRYRITQTPQIVGLVATIEGVLVVTDGLPYQIIGHTPAAMTPIMLASDQACMSSRSLVDMGDFAIYASPDGLISSDPGLPVITADYVDRDRWIEKYQPDTIRAAKYEGMYIAFYGDVDDATGFIFDPRQADRGLIDITGKVDAFFYDGKTDTLYVGYKQDVTTWRIGVFNAGAPLTYTWTSKKFMHPYDTTFFVGRVQADSYPVTFSYKATQFTPHGTRVHEYETVVRNSLPFSLPGGFKARQWELTVSGTATINQFGVWEGEAEVV